MTSLPAGFSIEHTPLARKPAGYMTSLAVHGPGRTVRFAVPLGATKWTIADALLEVIEDMLGPPPAATPEVLPFPEPAPVAG